MKSGKWALKKVPIPFRLVEYPFIVTFLLLLLYWVRYQREKNVDSIKWKFFTDNSAVAQSDNARNSVYLFMFPLIFPVVWHYEVRRIASLLFSLLAAQASSYGTVAFLFLRKGSLQFTELFLFLVSLYQDVFRLEVYTLPNCLHEIYI